MKQVYLQELNQLIDFVEGSRDIVLNNHEQFEKSWGSLIFLGDKNYAAYSAMVAKHEYKAAKVIEDLAVNLISESNNNRFSFISPSPDDPGLKIRIILTENQKKYGVAFSNRSDIAEYCKNFEDERYPVDALKVVVIANPDPFVKESGFTAVNEFNMRAGIPIERIPVLDFLAQYFGEAECDELIEFCKQFNEKAKGIIGFDTVITPTEKALSQFREQCGDEILKRSKNYITNIPDTIYKKQVRTIRHNYFDRGLWKAMIGKNNFAVSFITSEWFYKMYQMTENLDLTNIVAGYLKSVEQLLFAIIQLAEGTGIKINTKYSFKQEYGPKVELRPEYADIIDTTLGALQKLVKDHGYLLDVNDDAKNYLVKKIGEWCNSRNPYLHKGNLCDINMVNEIREKAFYLYFLILGSFKIQDEQFPRLGIESKTT